MARHALFPQAFRSPTSRDNGNGLAASSSGGGDDKGQTEQWVEDVMEEVRRRRTAEVAPAELEPFAGRPGHAPRRAPVPTGLHPPLRAPRAQLDIF